MIASLRQPRPRQPASSRPNVAALRRVLAASSLNSALRLVGDRWTQAIILEAYRGAKSFDQFRLSLKIPRQTLAVRLKHLVGAQIFVKRARPSGARQDYHIAEKGFALYGHILVCRQWEQRWGRLPTLLPRALLHTACGQLFDPVCTCAACAAAVNAHVIDYRIKAVPQEPDPEAGSRRWAGLVHDSPAAKARVGYGIIGLVADRWTMLTIAAVLVGCHRFDELLGVLDISSSVLAKRLAVLCSNGLLHKVDDAGDARRYVYQLTPASIDLFPYLVTLSDWAERYALGQPETLRLIHRDCGHDFKPAIVCSACRAPLRPGDVRAIG